MVLQVEATDISFPYSSILTVTIGSMRWYLHRQSIRAIARRFAVSPSTVSRVWRRFQETSSYSRRAGQGCRWSWTHQQDRYLLLCADEHCQSPTKWPPAGHWWECLWPNTQKQTSWGWPEGLRPLVGPVFTARHCGARLAFAIEHQNWQVRHWHPVLFTDESRFPLSTRHVNGSGEAVENSMTGLVLGQWWSGEAYPWRDAQTSTG